MLPPMFALVLLTPPGVTEPSVVPVAPVPVRAPAIDSENQSKKEDKAVPSTNAVAEPAKKAKKDLKWKPQARLIARFGYDEVHEAPAETKPDSTLGPALLQVRVGAKATWRDQVDVETSVELTDGLSSSSGVAYLRNAFVEWKPTKRFRLRVGHFKRPFSRFSMESRYDLWVPERTLLHRAAIRNRPTTLGWGQRAVGAMVSGSAGTTLHQVQWRVAATDPHYDGQGIDVHALAAYEYNQQVRVDVYGAFKRGKNGDKVYNAGAGGVALSLDLAGLHAIVEADAVQNWQLAKTPWLGSTAVLARYDFALQKELSVGPIASIELADDTLGKNNGLALRAMGGVTFGWSTHVRTAIYALHENPLGTDDPTASWREKTGYYLTLGVAL